MAKTMTTLQTRMIAYFTYVENFMERLPEKELAFKTYCENFGYEEMIPVIQEIGKKIEAM